MLNNSTENINITPSLSWWHFWGVWVLISITGWIIASNLWGNTILSGVIVAITLLIGQPARHFFDGNIILFGLIAGIAQWMLLRKQISFWWIVATAISFPIGFELGFFVSILSFFTEPTEIGVASATLIKVIGAALGGLIVGISQWVVLKQRIPQAKWWIWAVLLGWVMGLYLMLILPTIITIKSTELDHIINTWEAQFFVKVLVFNVIFSLFTGFALVWLLYQPAPNKIISLTPQGLRSLSITIGSALIIFLDVTYFQGPQTIVSVEEAPDSQTDNLLSDFKLSVEGFEYPFEIGGWAADSSGVYFRPQTTGGAFTPRVKKPIQKLQSGLE